jgi:hypothetical protein
MIGKLSPEREGEIIKYLQLGLYLEQAFQMAGIGASTGMLWLNRGKREQERKEKYFEMLERWKEADDKKKPTSIEKKKREAARKEHNKAHKREKVYSDFQQKVAKALAHSELSDLGVIARSAMGGAVLERKTVTTGEGEEATTTVFEKLSSPQWQASAWRLERRNPKRWARTQRIEVGGDDEKPPVGVVAMTMAEAVKAASDKKRARAKEKDSKNKK